MIDGAIVVRKNKLPGLSAALHRELTLLVEQGARALEAAAKGQIVALDAVDTGAMLNSGVVQPAGDLGRRVAFTTDYALYVHEGHHTRSGSFVPGRPFLTRAVEQVRPQVERLALTAVERAAS